MTIRRYPWTVQRCPACDRIVRLRKDGTLARHKGVNRFAQPGWTCVASRANVLDLYASPSWGVFCNHKRARGRAEQLKRGARVADN